MASVNMAKCSSPHESNIRTRENTTLMDPQHAAELLLSVSPVMCPRPSPPQPKKLLTASPLASLATLASMEIHAVSSGSAVMKREVPKLPLRQISAAKPNSVLNSERKCPSVLSFRFHDIYNKAGRVGIYTPEERRAIIRKFLQKRERRVWRKKIRYGCRKHLADQRMRVKGRFVKIAPEDGPLTAKNAANTGKDDKVKQETIQPLLRPQGPVHIKPNEISPDAQRSTAKIRRSFRQTS